MHSSPLAYTSKGAITCSPVALCTTQKRRRCRGLHAGPHAGPLLCPGPCKAGARTPTRPHPRLKVRLNVGARAALLSGSSGRERRLRLAAPAWVALGVVCSMRSGGWTAALAAAALSSSSIGLAWPAQLAGFGSSRGNQQCDAASRRGGRACELELGPSRALPLAHPERSQRRCSTNVARRAPPPHPGQPPPPPPPRRPSAAAFYEENRPHSPLCRAYLSRLCG